MPADRATYGEIRRDLLETYFSASASRGFFGETQEQVCSWTYCEFDGAYVGDTENLMLEVAALALTGGWFDNLVAFHRKRISEILGRKRLEDLLAPTEVDELHEFSRDLEILGVISSADELLALVASTKLASRE